MTHVSHVIVGQGLAGTALAWALRQRRQSIAVIDRGANGTSSQIAAGLITPVTGQRLAASWRFVEFFAAATAFYRTIEATTASQFFHASPMIRLFLDETERNLFAQRAGTSLRDIVDEPASIEAQWFVNRYGGFAMPAAARLDAASYLRASCHTFQRDGQWIVGSVEPESDLEFTPNSVRLPRFGLEAERVLFCQGYEKNPLFPNIPFNAAKGEILTLHISGLLEARVFHRGIWLAPLGDNNFLAGSTYDRERLDALPTRLGRDEITNRLTGLLKLPYEIVDHRAAIRPVMRDGRPMLGLHPNNARIGFFNGLGSKGALLTPFFAQQFAEALLGRGGVEPAVSLNRSEITS